MGMDKKIEKKKWPLKKIATYGGGAILVLALIALMIQSTGSKRLKVQQDRLSISAVAHGPFQEFIAITGGVMPIRTVFLDAGQGGRVEEIYMEGGEIVKKGDPILKLSNAGMELNYMTLETNLLEQADQLRNTKIALETSGLILKDQLIQMDMNIANLGQQFRRQESLFRDSVIPEQDYINMKNNLMFSQRRRKVMVERIVKDSVLTLRQLVQVDKSLNLVARNLSAIQKNLERMTVRAPVSGQLSSIRVEIGTSVGAGQAIGQVDVLDGGYKVRAQIDEHYISRVKRGQGAKFRHAGDQFNLKIKKVYPEVRNGTFEVDMIFGEEELPETITRGLNLQIRLALSEETKAILIARGGFYQSTGGNEIFVLDAEGNTARRRTIKIGRQSDRFYEVTSGLGEGERVITSNYDSFNDAEILILE